MNPNRRLITRRAADVPLTQIEWLWPQRLALGKLSLLAGDPGLGKSLLSLDIAARVSNGDGWPVNDGHAPQGSVLLLSAEDAAEDTVVPRLIAAGADLSRIHVIDAVGAEGDPDKQRLISLRRDVNTLERDMPADCRLLVVDPISAFLSGADDKSNSEIRELLMPLSEMARRKGCAVLIVSHLNKSNQQAQYRVLGSVAFGAAPRAVYCVVKDKDDPSRRLVLPQKNNIGNDTEGFAYRIEDVDGVPRTIWEGELVYQSLAEAMSVKPESSALEDAIDWLKHALRVGWVPQKDLERDAKQDGQSWATVRRAKAELGVKATRKGFGADGEWGWELPKGAQTPYLQDEHLWDSPTGHGFSRAQGDEFADRSIGAQGTGTGMSAYGDDEVF